MFDFGGSPAVAVVNEDEDIGDDADGRESKSVSVPVPTSMQFKASIDKLDTSMTNVAAT